MVETYKYKSRIATAVAFIATIIVCLGKDGLAKIIPPEYVWIIPVIVGAASWALAQQTEEHRVDVAQEIVHEQYINNDTTDNDVEVVDPIIPDEIITDEDIVGDELDDGGC